MEGIRSSVFIFYPGTIFGESDMSDRPPVSSEEYTNNCFAKTAGYVSQKLPEHWRSSFSYNKNSMCCHECAAAQSGKCHGPDDVLTISPDKNLRGKNLFIGSVEIGACKHRSSHMVVFVQDPRGDLLSVVLLPRSDVKQMAGHLWGLHN